MSGNLDVMMDLIQFIDPEGKLAPRRPGLFSKGDLTRLQCAKSLADEFVPKQMTTNSSIHVTKEMLYSDDSFVCAMWKVFGEAAKRYGYKIYRNVDCSKLKDDARLRDVQNPTQTLNTRLDHPKKVKNIHEADPENYAKYPEIFIKHQDEPEPQWKHKNGKIERPGRAALREQRRPINSKFSRQKKIAKRKIARRERYSRKFEEWED